MITVYVPPWEVLQDMFPDSINGAIINGETIKGRPAHDSQQYWWRRADELIGDNRLVIFSDTVRQEHMSIGNLDMITYRVFVEWLVQLDWRPYGEHKILKKRGPHVHSHNPDL